MPPAPVLDTNKVELPFTGLPLLSTSLPPDLIIPVVSTSNCPLVLVIFVAPLGFETSPAIEIPFAPVFSIVILPVP